MATQFNIWGTRLRLHLFNLLTDLPSIRHLA